MYPKMHTNGIQKKKKKRLRGNPPRIFDGTHSEADAFMNEFNLYHLTNIGADQVDNPMKRAALLLGFIQGENVKDWVKHWTIWALDQYNTGLASTDEHYWNTVARAFEQAFQDTGAMERAEEKLRHLVAPQKKFAGFSAVDLAKILNVKMLLPHRDAMDTWADRNCSANRNC